MGTITSIWNLKQSTPLVHKLYKNEQIYVDLCHLVGNNSSYSSISSTSSNIRCPDGCRRAPQINGKCYKINPRCHQRQFGKNPKEQEGNPKQQEGNHKQRKVSDHVG